MSELFNLQEGVISDFRGRYDFLSNFYKLPVTYDGITYPSTEAAYQAQKCFHEEVKLEFTKLTPGQSKRHGRQVLMRDDFEREKLRIMYDVNVIKFTCNPDLKEKLLATGNKLLIEGNTWGDRYWGQVNGVGQNKLGLILMMVRQHIRDGIVLETLLEEKAKSSK